MKIVVEIRENKEIPLRDDTRVPNGNFRHRRSIVNCYATRGCISNMLDEWVLEPLNSSGFSARTGYLLVGNSLFAVLTDTVRYTPSPKQA